MNQAPVKLVQSVYEAFGRRDIPAILALCTPDMTWEVVGPSGAYPLYDTFKGPEGGVRFFSTIAENEIFSDFAIAEIHAAEGMVTVLGHATYTLIKTGKVVDTDFIHLFRLRAGRVASFREFADTAQVVAAYDDTDAHEAVPAYDTEDA
ncbi:MAG TPA: nuclear transport factor 2 family protein [Phenylobacterium sp.]|nr:nuclear transport factor 2 family protein [Phenylobacterium sp.]